MKFKVDHDLHIHSHLSSCSRDPEQTPERILQYAKENGLKTVCLTDHYWDSAVPGASSWYAPQDFAHIRAAKPLPTCEGVSFLFGCETDLDRHMTLGMPLSRFDDFDFVIVPTTHLHMRGFTISEEDGASNSRRAALWVERFDALLSMPLPFEKIGIAHLVCGLINKTSREDYLDVLSRIPSEDMERLFERAARLGCGIELNRSDMSFSDADADVILRPFRIAKDCGCKFYLGSDAHHPAAFEGVKDVFERAVTLLDLSENDKFLVGC